MTDRELIDFLNIAEKMKCNTRHSWTSTNRKESVAEHSWRLSLIALLLEREIENVDFQKIIKMCIIHDLGEAITGDIPSFLKTKEDSKTEQKAITTLIEKLPEPQKTDMLTLFEEMEKRETMESKIYKALDRLEAVIQHNEAPIDSWLPLEYELQQSYGWEEAQVHERLSQLRQTAKQDTIDKIKSESKQ
ncbi:HD domain-containing protein [Lachnospiraceae bacterium 46-61]